MRYQTHTNNATNVAMPARTESVSRSSIPKAKSRGLLWTQAVEAKEWTTGPRPSHMANAVVTIRMTTRMMM